MKIYRHQDLTGESCTVVFSEDEEHRLDVIWHWGPGPIIPFCLLNPSTLNHKINDPTGLGIRKRARLWGYGGARIVNLFTLRTASPEAMKKHPVPLCAGADEYIRAAMIDSMQHGAPFVCGWGRHGSHQGRDQIALAIARAVGCKLHALVINDDGSPKHPLYIKHEFKPFVWKELA